MSNTDMPAMPQAATENCYECNHAERFNGQVPVGLTKREMIAMHISGQMLISLNSGADAGIWDYPSYETLATESVMYADALLSALSKR